MTCANCSQTVEKGLNNMDGVFNANVNLALETVSVNYNEKEVQIDDMVDKVKQLGYELIPQVDGEEKVDHKEKEIKKDRKSTRLNSSHVAKAYAVFCWKIKI